VANTAYRQQGHVAKVAIRPVTRTIDKVGLKVPRAGGQ
jgi:hypothetical protein